MSKRTTNWKTINVGAYITDNYPPMIGEVVELLNELVGKDVMDVILEYANASDPSDPEEKSEEIVNDDDVIQYKNNLIQYDETTVYTLMMESEDF